MKIISNMKSQIWRSIKPDCIFYAISIFQPTQVKNQIKMAIQIYPLKANLYSHSIISIIDLFVLYILTAIHDPDNSTIILLNQPILQNLTIY